MNLEEVQKKMAELQDWALEGQAIVKDFMFKDFKESMDFVNKVSAIAEKLGHHPTILIDYNYVHLTLTTHSEKGLTELDFQAAREIDSIGREKDLNNTL